MNPFERPPEKPSADEIFAAVARETEESKREYRQQALEATTQEYMFPDADEHTKPEIALGDLPDRASPARTPPPDESGIRPANGNEEPVSWTEFGEEETPVVERDVAKVWGVEDTRSLDRVDAEHDKKLAERLRRQIEENERNEGNADDIPVMSSKRKRRAS